MECLTRQGNAMMIAMIGLGSYKDINIPKFDIFSDRTSKWNTREKVFFLSFFHRMRKMRIEIFHAFWKPRSR